MLRLSLRKDHGTDPVGNVVEVADGSRDWSISFIVRDENVSKQIARLDRGEIGPFQPREFGGDDFIVDLHKSVGDRAEGRFLVLDASWGGGDSCGRGRIVEVGGRGGGRGGGGVVGGCARGVTGTRR